MKITTLTAEEKKAKKAAANKKYRARKKEKAELSMLNSHQLPEKFEKAFEFPVRLYKNLKLEKENSYRASAGALLKFERIKNENNQIVFRVRRTGRRTFFTTQNELVVSKA
jgi:hypothetical protein